MSDCREQCSGRPRSGSPRLDATVSATGMPLGFSPKWHLPTFLIVRREKEGEEGEPSIYTQT